VGVWDRLAGVDAVPVSLDIGHHRRLIHALGSPTVRHRRTGVAIDRLVSGEEDGASLL
jgi:hypothetical protein